MSMNENKMTDPTLIDTTKKPVTTNDIVHIYSHLQNMIDNVPPSPRLRRATSLQTRTRPQLHTRPPRKDSDCPCHHIFIPNSVHCALCDQEIPVLVESQHDRDAQNQKIHALQQTLGHQQDLVQRYQQDIKVLGDRVAQANLEAAHARKQNECLRNDKIVLDAKLALEMKEAQKAKVAKAAIEKELEELSQTLFEEANSMVANEKKAKYALEVQYNQVLRELKLCRERMEADELQLKLLKAKLEQESSSTVRSLFKRKVHGDEWIMTEFKAFVELGEESMPLDKLQTSVDFVKHSLEEDVKPCLRFGPQSRISAKKLYDAILMDTCFIEDALDRHENQPSKEMKPKISKSTELSSGFCQACGRNTSDLPYRFRTSMVDDWAYIDRYCRDRLVSVCEFYVFIRNVSQGYYHGRTIHELFQENVWLKLQMFYARMGELSHAISRLGIKGDMIRPRMIIPPPP